MLTTYLVDAPQHETLMEAPAAPFRPRSKRTLSVCALAMLLALLTPLPAQAQPLEVGITHIEVLPSVSEEYQPGQKFQLSVLDQYIQSNDWVQLPEWMGGKWGLTEETAVLRRDFKKNKTETTPYKFKVKSHFQYGMQRDRLGHIWHYIGTPYHSKTSLSNFDEYHIVKTKKFTRSDAHAVSFTTTMTVVRVQIDRMIDEVFQQESITTYTPADDGGNYIKLSASTKSFDAAGQPLVQTDNVARVRSDGPYAEVKTYQNKNMRELFREFLISKGMTNLLPD